MPNLINVICNKDFWGAEDGITAKFYVKGQEYLISKDFFDVCNDFFSIKEEKKEMEEVRLVKDDKKYIKIKKDKEGNNG